MKVSYKSIHLANQIPNCNKPRDVSRQFRKTRLNDQITKITINKKVMEILKMIYRKTFYFWYCSRIFIIFAFTIAITNEFDLQSKGNLIVGIFFTFYILVQVYLIAIGIFKKEPLILAKKFIGIVSILFGFLLLYLILVIGKNNFDLKSIGLLIVPFWIILYGFWELQNVNRALPKN